MKWTTATLAVLGTGGLLLAGQALLVPERATPGEILTAVGRRLERAGYDAPLALRDLTRAIEDGRAAQRPRVLADLYTLRARVWRDLSSFDSAQTDLQAVRTLVGGGDPELVLQTIELDALAGRVQQARNALRGHLRRNGDLPEGWLLAGQLDRELALERVREARDLAVLVLVREDAQRAGELFVELAARDPADPERPLIAGRLSPLFLPRFRGELTRVLDLVEQASHLQARARSAFARCFAGDGDPQALRAMIDLYSEAGHSDMAAELGRAARALPRLAESEPLAEALLRALVEQGNWEQGREIVREWSWRTGEPESFSLLALRVLFETGNWRLMTRPARALADLKQHDATRASNLYSGLASMASRDWPRAIESLLEYVNDAKGREPFEGSRGFAYLQLAQAYRRLGDDPLEREHLLRALVPPAGFDRLAWTRHVDGAAYVRYVELAMQERNAGYRRAEEFFTRALSLMPRRTAELRPRWEELGQLALEREGHDLQTLLRSMRLQKRARPGADVGPWAQVKLAEAHLEAGNLEGALSVARPLLRTYPGLIPALDVSIEAQARAGSRVQLLEDLLQRIELAGNDERSAAVLDRLDPSTLDPEQLLRLMRADPRGEGRRRVAEQLLARGQPAQALHALTPPSLSPEQARRAVKGLAPRHERRDRDAPRGEDRRRRRPGAPTPPDSGAPPDGGDPDDAPDPRETGDPQKTGEDLPAGQRMLLVRALVGLGRHGEALSLLGSAEQGPDPGDRILEAGVQARLGDGGPQAIGDLVSTLLARLEGAPPLPRPLVLGTADRLLALGQGGAAGALLTALDARVGTRGGDVLERMALERSLAEDRPGAELALERAEAFVEDGGVELARLLFAVEDRDWARLPERVADLRATGFTPTPVQDAALALLEERLEAAVQMATSGLGAEGAREDWAVVTGAAQLLTDGTVELPETFGPDAAAELVDLLRGREGISRDPREVLALFLAMDRPGWAAWARPRVEELAQKGAAPLWIGLLSARVQLGLGHRDGAFELYEGLTESHPLCLPAWERLETLVRAGSEDPWPMPLLKLRARRRAAVVGALAGAGAAWGSPLELALDEAAELYLEGRIDAAVEAATRALTEGGGGLSRGTILLARLLTTQGDLGAASTRYDQALANRRGVPDSPLVAEYLDLLRRAWQPGEDVSQGVSQGIDPKRVALALDSLATRFPRDPLVALERARLGVELGRRNPAQAGGMVGNLLRGFRADAGRAPLESLRRGSAAAWARFLVGLAPQKAEALVLEELAHVPGDLDLWHELARALEAQGRVEEALDLWVALLAMAPDPGARLAHAWLLVRTGGDLETIRLQLFLAQIDPLATRGDLAWVEFLRAVGELRTGREPVDTQLELFANLWQRRSGIRREEPLLLGRQYALALFLRHDRADLQALDPLLDTLGRSARRDPYTADLVTAYRGLLAAHRGVPPEQRGQRGPRQKTDRPSGQGPGQKQGEKPRRERGQGKDEPREPKAGRGGREGRRDRRTDRDRKGSGGKGARGEDG